MAGSKVFERCINCTDRSAGCHSTCEFYMEAKRLNDERNEMIRKAKLSGRLQRDYILEHQEKQRRKYK